MFDHVLVEKNGHIATVTINRPDKLNALNGKVVSELVRAFHDLMTAKEGETATRCAILTGTGKAFVAGADISEMVEMNSVSAKKLAEAGHRLGNIIENTPFPVIAAVNGFALGGGCELALSCDFIFAADSAKFGQPEVNLGVIPGFGGTQRLARRVGVAKARELIYTGDIITAEQARELGLVNTVYPATDLLAKTTEVATKIASKGPLAVASAKRAMLLGTEISLQAANQLETEAFAGLFGSEDQKTGMRAFLEKAKPTFVGK